MSTTFAKACDRALLLHSSWHQARHESQLLCRLQQRLEARLMVNTGISGLTRREAVSSRSAANASLLGSAGLRDTYAVACEAEVFAMTEALKFQDAIPEVAATSLAGIVAKLEMIVGADRDIEDLTDFPWPHITSVLSDLKAIAGDLPTHRVERAATRADVARHWEAAVRLVAALKEEEARELGEQPA